MPAGFQIKKLTIEKFRGLESFNWQPDPGLNFVIGGGDSGKSTVLDAISLLFFPANSFAVSETDFFKRDTSTGFEIEAVITAPEDPPFGIGHNIFWPWVWRDNDARVPDLEHEDAEQDVESVYKVRLSCSEEFELSWDVVQPDGSTVNFPASWRKKIGLTKLTDSEKSDRDLRLVYGAALDRLLGEPNLRSKLANVLSQTPVTGELSQDGTATLSRLSEEMASAKLPTNLSLGLVTSQGLSVGALIGLMASKDDVELPLGSWGTGTRRMAAMKIAKMCSNENSLVVVDEVERGLEPYRLRRLIKEIKESQAQAFLSTHSNIVVSVSYDAGTLWYMDVKSHLGLLDGAKIQRQQQRDPETFLSKLPIIVEGGTEFGFVSEMLTLLLQNEPGEHDIRVSIGQGDETIGVLEELAKVGISVFGFVDGDDGNDGRWANLRQVMGDRLFRWDGGCIETNIIPMFSDNYLQTLITGDAEKSGRRLATLAYRLGIADKSFDSILGALDGNYDALRHLIAQAATGDTGELVHQEGGENSSKKKIWKAHGQDWFKRKDGSGGRELLNHLLADNKWADLEPRMRAYCNAVLSAVGKDPVEQVAINVG
ncbi:ATP-dependent nuclease [Thalassospira lucentensis]|uniref:ATP-dependent nuclease n=1 Tax=Thalassospira lucentensis TaxID=168935 RepID=UPI003AA9D071